jgi:hypothetical protein
MEQRGRYNNYYLGHIPEGRARVGLYERAVQTDIYDGIDLHYYSNQAGIKYYFVLSPGADPADIELEFSGQSSLSLDTNGDLVVGTSIGDFRLPAPEAYQVDSTGQEVSTGWTPSYSVSGSVVTFSGSGSYDMNKELVLKLERSANNSTGSENDWVEYFGGSGYEDARDLVVGQGGFPFITGFTESTDLPETGMSTINGAFDSYVTKYASNRQIEWVTLTGGSSAEQSEGIDLSSESSALAVVGLTSSTDFPQATNSFGGGGNDGFVYQLNSTDGSLVNAAYIGGQGFDYLTDIVYDRGGNMVAVGLTTSSDLEVTNTYSTSSYYQDIYAGGFDGMIVQVESDLDIGWLTYFGGSDFDLVTDIEVDLNTDRVVVAGGTASSTSSNQDYATGCDALNNGNFPICNRSGAYNQGWGGGIIGNGDAFIAEFNENRELVWSTYFGGTGNEQVFNHFSRTRIDLQGDKIALSGIVDNGGGVYESSLGAYNDTGEGVYVSVFENRDLVWSSIFGCDEEFEITGVSVGDDYIFLSSSTGCSTPVSIMEYCQVPSSTGEFPICPGGGNVFFQDGATPVHQGMVDSYLAAFDINDFSLVWSTYFGGQKDDFIFSIEAYSNTLYLTGLTTSDEGFPLRNPINQDTYQGGGSTFQGDAFVGALDLNIITDIKAVNEEENRLVAYPNPTSGLLHVTPPIGARQATLYTSTGKVASFINFNIMVPSQDIDISSLPSGMYFMKTQVGNKVYSCKIILQ